MYNILRLTIMSGNFKLSEVQRRIKRLYATGDITETQYEELFSLLAEKADPELERPETLDLIQALSKKLVALTSRVEALEAGNTTGGSAEESDTADYPEWEPWDGLSQNYLIDTIVVHNGQLWKSTYSGQNVWEPGVVDERFWVRC